MTTCSAAHIFPPTPTLHSFWIVASEGYWYLAYFWHQFGNSAWVGLGTTFFTLFIGSLTSFVIGRMRIRGGWIVSNLALITYVIPASFLAIPFYLVMQYDGWIEHAVGLHRRLCYIRDALRDLRVPAVLRVHPDRDRRVGADRRCHALADLPAARTCR